MTTSTTASIDQEFEEWKLKYNKVYPSPEEEARRKALWLACRERVHAHNKLADEGKVTWWMEVNMFADLDTENGESPCGCGGRKPRRQEDKCGNTHGDAKHC